MKQLSSFFYTFILLAQISSLSMHSQETAIEETSAIFALFAIQAHLVEASQNSAIPSTVLPEAKDTPLAPLIIPTLTTVPSKPAPKQPIVLPSSNKPVDAASPKGAGLLSKAQKIQLKTSKAKGSKHKKPREKTPYTAVFSLNDPFLISRPTP